MGSAERNLDSFQWSSNCGERIFSKSASHDHIESIGGLGQLVVSRELSFCICVITLFCFDEFHGGLLVGGQCLESLMPLSFHVCDVCSQLGWKVQDIVPTLRFSHSFSIISVVVKQCFQVCFLMISVGLRTDQGAIESHTDLFEQSVGEIVCGPEPPCFNYVVTIRQFERQLNPKETVTEIHIIFLRIH